MLRHTHVHKFLLPGIKAHVIPRLLWLSACCTAYGQTSGPKVEFEVASLTASPPPSGGMMRVGCTGGPGQTDPGMFRCQNMSLKNFITQAYNISYYQVTAPDWAQSQMFDLAAKVPVGATKEDLAMMLQNMLIDRFQLKTHRESREITKYELVVAKNGPKLKEAVEDPPPQNADNQVSPAKPTPQGPPALDADGYPKLVAGRPGMTVMRGRARLFYPKYTMKALAGMLGAQLGKPCTDATGLTGQYDVALFWSTDSMRAGAAPPTGAVPQLDGPEDNGPTLEKAIQDQLRLRLESKKGPAEFLVVDHLEKLPSEN